jgi:hypothetical protein
MSFSSLLGKSDVAPVKKCHIIVESSSKGEDLVVDKENHVLKPLPPAPPAVFNPYAKKATINHPSDHLASIDVFILKGAIDYVFLVLDLPCFLLLSLVPFFVLFLL